VSEVLVQVNRVSKRFCRNLKQSLWYGLQDIAGELCGLASGGPDLRVGEFWAVNDVSFELRRGECLGLIGANGAGKSTLLKMLNGLIKPDAGSIRVRGRVGALIELGAGFHPLLSGRENIYVNASILGMSKRETDRRLDEIIAFADIGDAIDAPVKSYSSGMRVRLGFAVAAHLEPDILLIDEVLAVGDLAFRVRCYRRLSQLRDRGTAVVLISHNSLALSVHCISGLLLQRGRCVSHGPVGEVLQLYEAEVASVNLTDSVLEWRRAEHINHDADVTLLRVAIESAAGALLPSLESGVSATLRLRVLCRRPIEKLVVHLKVFSSANSEGESLTLTSGSDPSLSQLACGVYDVEMTFAPVCLPPGNYALKIGLANSSGSALDALESYRFNVKSCTPMLDSWFFQPVEWSLSPISDQLIGAKRIAERVAGTEEE
jgi:lipopolysaccharide transport system ATP-binding protein